MNLPQHDPSDELLALTVTAGTTVTWVNNDDAEHTVDAKDGSFSSGGTLKTIDII